MWLQAVSVSGSPCGSKEGQASFSLDGGGESVEEA